MSTQRKTDHIRMAMEAQAAGPADPRFYYEPLLGHQDFSRIDLSLEFLGRSFAAPLWVSSMTGGGDLSRMINGRLARAVARFGLGMGLGSLRPLLEGKKRFEDFHVRPILGPDRPLYGNIGVAQVDQLLQEGRVARLQDLLGELQCDGIIIHVNPLQEWYQREGDLLKREALNIIREFLQQFPLPVIVKEVGQGMGPRSLRALAELPLAAVELSAFGGSNFSQLEWQRGGRQKPGELARVGHSAEEMIDWINDGPQGQFIISGGIRSFLDGHYLMQKLKYPGIYGQASPLLKRAMQSQSALDEYIESQLMGLRMVRSFLRIRNGEY